MSLGFFVVLDVVNSSSGVLVVFCGVGVGVLVLKVLNWMVGYGIGSIGNFYEIQTFSGEYDGLNSVEIGDDGIEYVDNASFTGDASGFGDYTPGPASILRNRVPLGLATFSVDLFGASWGNTGNGSAGAIQRVSDL
jgi:hypothetical protein